MDLQYCVKESELFRHTARFEFPLESVKQEWKRQLLSGFTNDSVLLHTRADRVQRLAKQPTLVETCYSKLKALQEDENLILNYKPTDTSQTAEEQIFFTGPHTQPFNEIPYLLTFFVFFKIILAPILGLMSPLILFIMPYFVMHTLMNQKIPWSVYVPMMKQMMFGISPGSSWSAKQYVQMLWTLISLGQGIMMPFVTAYHTYKLDSTIVSRGEAIQRIAGVARDILQLLKTKEPDFKDAFSLQVPDVPTDIRAAVAWSTQERLALPTLLQLVGRIGVIVTMARDPKWQVFTPAKSSDRPLILDNIYDLAIPTEKAVRSSVELRGNSLLTGPNRGGKSSSLRAILQQVLLAQTFGLTYDCRGSWKLFRNVFTRLKSKDHAGKESLFEMEVRMAASMLNHTEKSNAHTLLLIDELFHSTNPPDAEMSAKVFLNRLWKLSAAKSIISTHIFSLCEAPGHEGIQTFCVAAEEQEDDILYSYRLQPGICRTSSVREVLRESGLLTSRQNIL